MEELFLYNTLSYLYYLFIKWCVLKPMVQLSYIINGRMLPPVKWYQREYYNGKSKWTWLGRTSYKLTKYVMFTIDPQNEN